jgi:phosphoglycolate phosphatase
MPNYNTYVFDLDGTLVRTKKEYRYVTVGNTLKELGKEPVIESIDKFWFGSNRDEIIRKDFKLDAELFWNTFYTYDTLEQRKPYLEVYNDVGIINELRQRGYRIGLVTGAPKEMAMMEIGLLGDEFFGSKVIANPRNGIKSKPDPEGLEICLRELGSSKNETVYIGNAMEDVETARNAEVRDILINRGEHDISQIKASLTIHSLYELRGFLNRQS